MGSSVGSSSVNLEMLSIHGSRMMGVEILPVNYNKSREKKLQLGFKTPRQTKKLRVVTSRSFTSVDKFSLASHALPQLTTRVPFWFSLNGSHRLVWSACVCVCVDIIL